MDFDLGKVMEMITGAGCAEARVVLLQNSEFNVSVVNGEEDKRQQSDSVSLALTLYDQGREGFYYTNVFEDDALSRFVRQSVEATKLLTPDPTRGLIDADRYYKGGGVDLRNFDESMLHAINVPNLCAKHTHPAVVSSDTRFTSRVHRAHYMTTDGFDASERSTRVTLSTLYTVRGEGDQKWMDGWGQTRLFQYELPSIDEISDIALQRSLRKIGQCPVPKGIYTLVVESPVADTFLSPLLNAMSGQSLQQHASFLEGKRGEIVGSHLLDVIDNPHLPGTRGATYFDYDGAATRPLQLFDEGRLCTYFLDTPMARKLGMMPTTQGVHHLIFTPSQQSLQEVLNAQEECILVVDFNGGNCNPVTGHFSYGIEGYLYRNGNMVQPVSGMNITGNLLDLWQHLVAVANDADPYEADLIPSLVFEEVSFC